MVKRIFDILVSGLALMVLSPLLLLIVLVVASTSPGGAFFRQVRVGRNGRAFRLLKFRSMRPDSESRGQITVGGRDPRITSVGFFLRKSKLDELPQLLNVFVGDMSIVGPRPEVPKYVALYTREQQEVLRVRPGITSAASIAYIDENELLGRSADPERTYMEEVMPAKLKLDIDYVAHHTFLMDLVIIYRTFIRIFR